MFAYANYVYVMSIIALVKVIRSAAEPEMGSAFSYLFDNLLNELTTAYLTFS